MTDTPDDFVYADYDLELAVVPVGVESALPYPDVAAHDDPGAVAAAVPGAAVTPAEAVQKARLWHRERITMPVGFCLGTVRQYYEVHAGVLTAANSYNMSAHKHNVPRGVDVPFGTPVYWTGGSTGAGHIAISVGGGVCLSTDWAAPGKIDYARIDDITSHWALNFKGFTEEVNGVHVWRPAPPIGTVHLANLRPGEKNDDVLKLKRRLYQKGYRGFIKSARKFGAGTRRAYAHYQRNLGYTGTDANGIPGVESLQKLGFRVL